MKVSLDEENIKSIKVEAISASREAFEVIRKKLDTIEVNNIPIFLSITLTFILTSNIECLSGLKDIKDKKNYLNAIKEYADNILYDYDNKDQN